MSFENFGQNDFMKNLTPTLNLLNELKNNPNETPKSLVLRDSCEERKKSLEDELKKGINITSENEFNALIGLLVKNGIIKEALKLDGLKDNHGNSLLKTRTYRNIMLSFRKVHQTPDKISVYVTTPPIYETDIFPRSGYIDNNGKFEYNPDTSFFNYDDKTNPKENSGKIPKEIGECKIEEKTTKPEPVPEKEKVPEETHIEYKIKKGDYLWKIISEKYDLKPEKDKNAIWQIMEQLKKDPKNDGLIKKDAKTGEEILYIGDIIHLQKTTTIKKGKKDIKISLKEKEAE